MYIILDSMTRLMAPILAYTADEIWEFMPHKSEDCIDSVIFNQMQPKVNVFVDDEFISKWSVIQKIRDESQKALELSRKNKEIGKSLEAKVILYCQGELYDTVLSLKDELSSILIVSQVEVINGDDGKFKGETLKDLSITVQKADGEKCERCWIHSESVGSVSAHPTLCKRCAEVIQ